jgi:hypothetical protein
MRVGAVSDLELDRDLDRDLDADPDPERDRDRDPERATFELPARAHGRRREPAELRRHDDAP